MDYFKLIRIQTTRYREKPILADWINIGYFYLRSECFNQFAKYKSFENFILSFQKKNQLNAFRHKGNHIAVNTISELINAKQNIKLKMNKYWKNKNILITGINGFVAEISEKLINLKSNVYGIIRTQNYKSLLC